MSNDTLYNFYYVKKLSYITNKAKNVGVLQIFTSVFEEYLFVS